LLSVYEVINLQIFTKECPLKIASTYKHQTLQFHYESYTKQVFNVSQRNIHIIVSACNNVFWTFHPTLYQCDSDFRL